MSSSASSDPPSPGPAASGSPPNPRRTRHRRRGAVLRCTLRWGSVVGLLLLLAILFWFSKALYHRWILFPRQEASLATLQAQRQTVESPVPWREFRGVVHSHSELSHDCAVPFDEILRVLEQTGRDFICLSDHPDEGRADFSTQWRGLYRGKVFIPGFEMRQGWMPLGVRSDVVLSNSMNDDALARQIVEAGGLLFFAHPEEPRAWDRSDYVGMEIYNIHADFKNAGGLGALLPDLLINQHRYPDRVFRQFFSRPSANLRRWDALNRIRPVVGIAGNDCHQNTGLRIICTPTDTLRLEDTGPETLWELPLNRLSRWLASRLLGPLEPGRVLVQLQLDPYERMVRHVTTHLFALELSETAVLEALRAGRVFLGFDSLADSSGFLWLAETPNGRAWLGETRAYSPMTQLRAYSPLPCRFTVMCDGQPVLIAEGRQVEWTPPAPGSYRVEAELNLAGTWTPWVYANPIHLRATGAP